MLQSLKSIIPVHHSYEEREDQWRIEELRWDSDEERISKPAGLLHLLLLLSWRMSVLVDT